MKTTISTLLFLVLTISISAQDDLPKGAIISSPHYSFYEMPAVQNEDWKELYKISSHPTLDNILSAEEKSALLKEVNQRRQSFKNDTLRAADMFYIWKPYFDRLNYEDPHYRVGQHTRYGKRINDNYLKILPFSHLQINDTIIIDKSIDSQFKKGDMILSLNDTPISEILKYVYKDRYCISFILSQNYYFNHPLKHIIELQRDGKLIKLESEGADFHDVVYKLNKGDDYKIQLFEDAKCGYIAIDEFFPNNSRLIKKVHSAIKNIKKRGYANVILDLRRNPGGSGHNFVELMSIFINKPTVQYLKGQKLKVTEQTIKDFDFLTEDMLGTVVDIPEDNFVKEFETHHKMHVDGVTYYVLISRNTGSMAASFVNMLQYNDVAKLVGEPLMRNALKYGEVLYGLELLANSSLRENVSTVEIDEHTKATDGVLMPDIHIPYVAKDYLTGKDAMLEKLLEHISSQGVK